jgi:putative acetyltransferase
VRVKVCAERDVDRAAVHALHDASFPTQAEARLVDLLRASGRLWLSLVAVSDEEVVGHVSFSPVQADGAEGGVALAPLAVAEKCRRRGIGARLVEEGLAGCRRGGRSFVVVVGDPAYYARFGFAAASRWGLRDEFGGGPAFQALELRPGAIPPRGGTVRYAPEFADL